MQTEPNWIFREHSTGGYEGKCQTPFKRGCSEMVTEGLGKFRLKADEPLRLYGGLYKVSASENVIIKS